MGKDNKVNNAVSDEPDSLATGEALESLSPAVDEKPKAQKSRAKVWMEKGNVKAHVHVPGVDEHLADGFVFSPGLVAVYKKGAGKSVQPDEAIELFRNGWSDSPVG
ncbi:MAG: hypothetical protein OEZ32_08120 [Nitrospinota bacterium]|nr:hypothetical protein [Nitrospinota bacterium]